MDPLKLLTKIMITILVITNAEMSTPCISKYYGTNDMVCLCNSTVCDTFEVPTTLTLNHFYIYTSSQSGLRFNQEVKHSISNSKTEDLPSLTIKVDGAIKYQTILGFGGALTDSTLINYHNVSKGTRNSFLKSYYSRNHGIAYTLARLPIASCDFSIRVYSYNDVKDDFEMEAFKLGPEDMDMRIPIIQSIQNLLLEEDKDGASLNLFGSPWSAPAWLKTNRSMIGGKLIADHEHYTAWARYMTKYVEAYKDAGITIWGLSFQNEPVDGYLTRFPFQSMLYTAEEGLNFTINYLCPALKGAGLRDTAVMIFDDNRPYLEEWVGVIMPQLEVSTDCVKGIAVHWYENHEYPASIQTSIHESYPNYFILPTEACTGFEPGDNKVRLGSWARAEYYARDIMDNLLNWAVGWTDWNMGLNEEGGPNWIKNYVDSPIIFNASADEFYKQPMFYAIGHYSKFLSPGSVRIGAEMSGETSDIYAIAFETPRCYVAIILNVADQPTQFELVTADNGNMIHTIDGHSIVTIAWNRIKGPSTC